MSRRRNTTRETTSGCAWRGCDQPTRDGAYVCDGCLDELADALRELLPAAGDRVDPNPTRLTSTGVAWCPWPRPAELVPGLWDDLISAVAGEQGVDYRTLSIGAPSDATGIALAERAAEIAKALTQALRALVIVCRDARVEHTAPAGQRLKGRGLVPDMVEWLLWRVDGIALHPEAAARAQDVRDAVDDARWVIDRPSARQQLGDCIFPDCDGWLSAAPGARFARCNREDHSFEAQPIRDRMLSKLDDRLCTAAEIARLSTYLGLRADRTQVANRIRQWAHRGVIAPHAKAAQDGEPRYRFADVYPLLLPLVVEPDDQDSTSTTSKGA